MAFHHINGIKIRTTHEFPPIPDRSMDWSAIDDDNHDVDCDGDGFFSRSPIGRGPTEQDAINDLLEQIEDRADSTKPHKIMTTEEYATMVIAGWHEVCRDIDGAGNVGVRFIGPVASLTGTT